MDKGVTLLNKFVDTGTGVKIFVREYCRETVWFPVGFFNIERVIGVFINS